MRAGRTRWHYAWVVVAVTFGAMVLAAAARYSAGVLIQPMENEFGWDRGSISFAVAIGLFIFGLAGPGAGALLDRFGPRRVMLAGMALTIAGFGPLLVMRELWQLYLLWGVLGGLGTGAISGTVGAVVAARWFKARRGLVIGVFNGATSTGQLIFIPLLLSITVATGWRSAVVLLTMFALVLVLPIAVLVRDHPSEKGLLPVGEAILPAGEAPPPPDAPSMTIRQALRIREFWLLAGSLFICGYTTSGLIMTHMIPYSLEHGFDEATTAGVMGLMGAMNLAGTLTSGWLTDRYDNRKLLAMYYGLRAIALLSLPFILESPQLIAFAILYGMDWIATAPPTVNLTTNIFGKGSLGTVYGWIFFAHQFGAAVAAYTAGYMHGVLGSYNVVFISASLIAFVAAGFSLCIRSRVIRPELAKVRAGV